MKILTLRLGAELSAQLALWLLCMGALVVVHWYSATVAAVHWYNATCILYCNNIKTPLHIPGVPVEVGPWLAIVVVKLHQHPIKMRRTEGRCPRGPHVGVGKGALGGPRNVVGSAGVFGVICPQLVDKSSIPHTGAALNVQVHTIKDGVAKGAVGAGGGGGVACKDHAPQGVGKGDSLCGKWCLWVCGGCVEGVV